MKHCPKCQTTKPFASFYKSRSRPDGVSSYCKDCMKQVNRDSRQRHNYKLPPVGERKCETCNQYFDIRSNNLNQKFCSRTCYGKSKQGMEPVKLTERGRQKISEAKLGDKNPNWKGDKVGKSALHAWVKRHLPKTKLCQECNEVPPYDLANISQEYKRDFDDWEWLCRKCHMTKDGRIEVVAQMHKGYVPPREATS